VLQEAGTSSRAAVDLVIVDADDDVCEVGLRISGQATVRVLDDDNQSGGICAPCVTICPNSPRCPRRTLIASVRCLNQQLSDPEDYLGPLGLFALHGHKTPFL